MLRYVVHTRLQGVPLQDGSAEVRGSHPSSGRTSAKIAALREGCSRISTPPSFPLTSAGEKCRSRLPSSSPHLLHADGVCRLKCGDLHNITATHSLSSSSLNTTCKSERGKRVFSFDGVGRDKGVVFIPMFTGRFHLLRSMDNRVSVGHLVYVHPLLLQ